MSGFSLWRNPVRKKEKKKRLYKTQIKLGVCYINDLVSENKDTLIPHTDYNNEILRFRQIRLKTQ